ncbi:DUF4138 domain-containing protein [Maribacter sp. 2-571]|uniref:DUF4138 domain-containing protein n=1 Tax=Maribacter sp. 2-571 TaxID=3417569 RepID=UPI003D33CC3A
MKIDIIIATLLISVCAPRLCTAQTTAQQPMVLDTIYANEYKNVALFFPEPIRQGITGADNFVFTYNRDKEQYFGLLQAKPGKESNLLVINRDGSIFSYLIRYRAVLDRLNYFVPISKSIGNEKPLVEKVSKVVDNAPKIGNNVYHYAKFCSYLLDRKRRISRARKGNQGILLHVENLVFDKEELYFVIEIENRSSLDYDLNFLNLSVQTRSKGKRKSLQTLWEKPVYVHNLPTKVAAGQHIKMVYVVPKFSISKERRVLLELNEKNGERNIALKLSHRFINNPN